MYKINKPKNHLKVIIIAIIAILLFILIGIYELYVINQFNQYTELLEETYMKDKILFRFRDSFRELQVERKNEMITGHTSKGNESIQGTYNELNDILKSYNDFQMTDEESTYIQSLNKNLSSYYNSYGYRGDLNRTSGVSLQLSSESSSILTDVERLLDRNSEKTRELSLLLIKYYPSIENNIALTVIISTIIFACLAGITTSYVKKHDKKLFKLAYYDIITDVPNRDYFMHLVSETLNKCKKRSQLKGFILIDAHTVTRIDNTLGSKIGDGILRQIGSRLKNEYDDLCIVGRLGGCVFMMLTPNVDSKEEISKIANGVIDLLNVPFLEQGHELNIDVNLGISVFPQQGLEAEDLEKRAGNALISSNKNGNNIYKYFDETLENNLIAEIELEKKLKLAISNESFHLHYQPILNSKTNNIDFYETLIRWKDTDGKMISPLEFLPVAERNGDINKIGNWVLRNACRQIVEWQQMGHDFSVTVNVSPIQFQESNFVDNIEQILKETGINPKRLILEITENIFIENFELMEAVIGKIKSLGIRIALDDFGTGYSSLGYLRRLPIDYLKIDKVFIECLNESTEAPIIDEIISISQKLGLKVIAEGVETEMQLNELKKLNSDYLQGYYISRPQIPQDVMKSYIQEA